MREPCGGETKLVFFVVAIVITALLLAIGLAAVVRPLLAVAVGIGVFLVAGSWQATRSDEGPGETPNGFLGFWLALFWILLPWLVGVALGRLIASRRAA
jgi:hypothetical protein